LRIITRDPKKKNSHLNIIENFEEDQNEKNGFSFNKLIDKIPIMNPKNNFLYFWDSVHALAIIFCVYYLPIEMVSFPNFADLYGQKWVIVTIFCLCIFIFEIII
jgi:hypothetical protein